MWKVALKVIPKAQFDGILISPQIDSLIEVPVTGLSNDLFSIGRDFKSQWLNLFWSIQSVKFNFTG